MVFDEVDAGIGGAVAEIVGRELRSLGVRGQVLCVTHLPQVACQAHHHLRVTKVTDGRTTRTTLAELDGDERIEELARMLGGVEITAKAREHARDMLSAATLTGKTATEGGGGSADASKPAESGKGGDTVRQPRPPAARRR
jgi:DNA repair protein RecN (Recombination protein N)